MCISLQLVVPFYWQLPEFCGEAMSQKVTMGKQNSDFRAPCKTRLFALSLYTDRITLLRGQIFFLTESIKEVSSKSHL